ncbi:complement C1q tumor necrosis factor-related protein 3-like [Hoplias malabaricus]|uniref:complement C1q tumor necrosis factor-related protein 3-like n=1 Tax=Hoplias malabaricus TaxID=27720 RepID=UPI00346226D2
MRAEVFSFICVTLSLFYWTVSQAEDGQSAGSHSNPLEYPEYTCSSTIYSELKELKTMVAEQKTLLGELKKQAGEACITGIHSELKELKSTVAEQKFKLEELQKQIADKPNVAFSASLFGEGGQTIGGHSSEITLIFKKVFINFGNAYNPATGIFTAPVQGVYYFGFSAFANGKSSMGVHLCKNGQNVVATYDYNSSQKDVNGANRAILQLEKGDQVYITLWGGLHIFDSYNRVSTFSGFLLFVV